MARAFGSGRYLQEADPLDRLLGCVDFMIELSRTMPPGCIAGIFSQELAPTDANVRMLCAKSFNGMRDFFERLIAQAKASHASAASFDPRSVAEHLQAVHQGAMILARAHQRPEIVAEHLLHFRAYLQALFGSGRPRPSSPGSQRESAVTPSSRRRTVRRPVA